MSDVAVRKNTKPVHQKVNAIVHNGIEFRLVRANHLRNLIGTHSHDIVERFTDPRRERFMAQIAAKGGATVATYVNMLDGKLYTGVSVCSDRDSYCKNVGLVNAAKRAIGAYENNVQIGIPKIVSSYLVKKDADDGYVSYDAQRILVTALKQNPECIPLIR